MSKQRINFSGSSTIANLSTDKIIKTSGSCKIAGDVEANGFSSSGSVRGTGNLLIHGNFKNSGSFKLIGSIFSEGKAVFSGSTNIEGDLEVKRSMVNSGSLNIIGKLSVIGQIKMSGKSNVKKDITVLGTLINSGSLNAPGIKVKDYITSSGSLKTSDGIESEKVIDISGGLSCGGDLRASSVLINFKKIDKIYKFKKYLCFIAGNIYATDLISIDRTFVKGDIRGRSVMIGKRSKVNGNIFYVDDCIIDDKAVVAHQPIKINLDEL